MDNNEHLKNIAGDVKNISNSVSSKIRMPGSKGPKEEIEYSMMDMIAGICGAALFGVTGKNAKTIQQYITKPKQAIFSQISDNVKDIKNIVSKNADNKAVVGTKGTNQANISNLDNFVDGNSPFNLLLTIETIGSTEEFLQSLVELTRLSNNDVANDICNFITELDKIVVGLNNLKIDKTLMSDNVDILQNIKKFYEGLGKIKIPTIDFSNLTHNEIAFRQMVDNIKGLSDPLKDLQTLNINDLSDSFNKIDALAKTGGIESLANLFDSFNELGKIKLTEDSFKQLTKNIQVLKANEDLFKSGGILSSVLENLKILIDDIGTTEKIEIADFGEIISAFMDIISINPKQLEHVDESIDIISELVAPNGRFAEIISNMSNLAIISDEQINSVYILNSYINSLTNIANIGLRDKLRIIVNIEFIRHFVIDALKKLIETFNDEFAGLNVERNDAIRNISSYINQIANIGQAQVNDILKSGVNIDLMRHLIIDKLVKLVLKFNESFKNIDVNDTKNLLKFFNTIEKTLTIKFDIDEQRKNLRNLKDYLFGTTFLGKRLGIISKLQDENKPSVVWLLSTLTSKEIQKVINDTQAPLRQLSTVLKAINLLPIIKKKNIREGVRALKEFKRFLIQLEAISKTLTIINKLNLDERSFDGLRRIATGIKNIIDEFKDIDVNTLKQINNLFERIMMFFVVGASVLIVGGMLMRKVRIQDFLKLIIGLTVMFTLTNSLFKTINKFKITEQDVKNASKLLGAISLFMLGAVAVLTVVIKAAREINKNTFVAFGIFLGMTMLMVTGTIALVGLLQIADKLLDKYGGISKSIKFAFDLSLLILTLGATLALGAVISANVNPLNLVMFGVGLSILIAATLIPISFFKGGLFAMAEKSGKELGIVILCLGISLAIGAAITQYIKFKDILTFGAILSLLITVVTVPLTMLSITGKAALQGGKDLGILILYVTAALGIGALFMNIPMIKNHIIEFANLYTKFLLKFFVAVGLCSLLSKHGFSDIKNLTAIIKWSTISLLLGGLIFMQYPRIKRYVFEFTDLLTGFIWNISLAIGILGLIGEKGLKSTWQLALLITVLGTVLVAGPIILKQYKIKIREIWDFVLLMTGFVAAIGLICGLLGYFSSFVGIGLAIMAAIGLLIVGFAWALKYVAENLIIISELLDQINWQKLSTNIDSLLGLTLSISATLLALAVTGAVALIAAPFVWILKKVINNIMDLCLFVNLSISTLQNVKKSLGNTKMEDLFKPIKDYIKAASEALDGMSLFDIPKILIVSKTMSRLGEAIGNIALGLQAMGNLSVPIKYDSNGKPIEFRAMTFDEMSKAGDVAIKIITSIGGAIIGWMKNPKGEVDIELVKILTDSAGLFGRDTKFGRLIKSTGNIGNAISKIAKGVQSYASLAIPVYDNKGNIKTYRTLNDNDFNNATKNITKVISTVGKAILGLLTDPSIPAELREALLKPAGIFTSDTKFGKVVAATAKMGDVIGNISKGVQDYANLRVPIHWNKNGEPDEWLDILKNGDGEEGFFQKAANNIQKVIITIGSTLIATYKLNKDMFEGCWISKSPIKRVMEASIKMGEVISSITKGVQDYAMLRIPTAFDPKTGQPTGWRKMNDSDFKLASDHISQIVTTIGDTLSKVAQSDTRGIFDIGSESPVTRVSKAIANVSSVIGSIAQTLHYYASGKFPMNKYVDGKLVTYDFTDELGEQEFNKAKLNIKRAIETLGGALFEAINENDNLKKLKDNKNVEGFKNAVQSITSNILTIANSINALIKLDIKENALDPFIIVVTKYLYVANSIADKTKIFRDDPDIFNIIDTIQEKIDWIRDIDTEFEQSEGKGLDILNTEFCKILATIQNIKNNDAFIQHTKTMQDYVAAVDKVNITKVKTLTNLVDAINEFGKQFGNIDEFTTAVVDRLSDALKHLATKLTEAKEAINKADTLHEKREKTIRTSINTVKELMERELTVNIHSEELEESTYTPGVNNETKDNTQTDASTTETITPSTNKTNYTNNSSGNGGSGKQNNIVVNSKVVIDSAAASEIGKKIADAINQKLQQ